MADVAVETITPGIITITYTGAGGAWDSKTHFPAGLKLKSIKFWPSAANDILAVRNGSASAAIMAKLKDTTGAGLADVSFGEGIWCFPYVLVSDCTFNTITNVIIIFVLA